MVDRFLPTELDLVFQWGCNLTCDYCTNKSGPDNAPASAEKIQTNFANAITWFLNMHIASVAAEKIVEEKEEEKKEKDNIVLIKKEKRKIKINFLGQEPLLNFTVTSFLLSTARNISNVLDLDAEITVKTNLQNMDGEKIAFLKEHNIIVEAHVDGDESINSVHKNGVKFGVAHSALKDMRLLGLHPTIKMVVTQATIVDMAKSALHLLSFTDLVEVEFICIEPEWPSEFYSTLDLQIRECADSFLNSSSLKGKRLSFLNGSYTFTYKGAEICKKGNNCGSCGVASSRCAVNASGDIFGCYKAAIDGRNFYKIGDLKNGVNVAELNNPATTIYDKITPFPTNAQCQDCECAPTCNCPCFVDLMCGNRIVISTDPTTGKKITTITPYEDFCQISRIVFSEVTRLLNNGIEQEQPVNMRLTPKKEIVKTNTVEKVGPLPTAEERVKDRKTHPFGVLPGVAPPPHTDESFTTMKSDFMVSVVYASMNEGEEVAKTVESAIAATTGPLEVIVVDDASTDGSCEGLNKYNTNNAYVIVITLKKSVGAGMARNIGFAAARGRVVVSSDAHMRYPKGMWHEIGGFVLEKHAIACPGVAAMFGGPQGWGAKLNYHRDGKIGCSYYRTKGTDPELTTGVLGACYFVPREIFDDLTRWPSINGKWGYEESALNSWAWLHGVECYCFPKYTVRHLYRSEAAKGSKEPPWGYPPTSDLNLNHLASHLALFDRETYENVWEPHYINQISPEHRSTLEAMKAGKLYETGHWQKGRIHSDAEFFRDVLRVPTETCGEHNQSIKKVLPISVILTAYNEGKEVELTLRSIINSGQTRFEIILVDDASTDGSIPDNIADNIRPKLAGHWRADIQDRIRIIRHTERIGVSRSRAEAISVARGEMICVMDCHQRVITQYGIEWAAAHAQEKDGIVVVNVCNLGNAKKSEARTYGARFSLKPKWGILNSHITTKPDTPFIRRDAIIGAGYVMSKKVLNRLGGWPTLPGLWAYNEQYIGLAAWIIGVPMYASRDITFEHMYKKGTMDVPHVGTLMNAHLIHYLFFGDVAYEYFKPYLLEHGYDDRIDTFLKSEEVQKARAIWTKLKEAYGKTDGDFFAMLGKAGGGTHAEDFMEFLSINYDSKGK